MMEQKITIDPSNWSEMLKLMDRADEFKLILLGENADGETTFNSINNDCIIIGTCQSNGWLRKNVYWRDLTVEEMYAGKWM